MKPRREIEIKLKVTNPRKLKRLLRGLGFRLRKPRHLERNALFDFRDRRLARARCALRLRSAGGFHLLTFKGTASLKGGYKSREELETCVESGQALRRILKRLGLREAFSYNKHRTVYTPPGKSGKSLVYDETPVGNYIEIEGPRRWIDRVAGQLGYNPKDYVTTSYVALYLRGRAKAGQKGPSLYE